MQTSKLISESTHAPSASYLDAIYKKGLIPGEKKPFLIDLGRSTGPLMAVEQGDFILDVASQIASLGLGFNPGALFGTAEFLESWTGRTDTETVTAVRRAYHELLSRPLSWPKTHLHLCHSGAEAIEIALGACYEQRINRSAKKLIAFEGSFHGRTMVALASTWNAAKREPFAWPGFETQFVPYPEMTLDDIQSPMIPAGWQQGWASATRRDFTATLQSWNDQFAGDELLAKELDSLRSVKELLMQGNTFAVMIEPMQCEGGDRYSSARFHHGLINLACAFGVPLIYDEIQTGLGLGGEFYWHEKFNLIGGDGEPATPDFVVLAKKAQVGAVLSHRQVPFPEQFNAASLVRGYIQASIVDQFQSKIRQFESKNRVWLADLVGRFSQWISRPRASGLCFAFDFHDSQLLTDFVKRRFDHGLLYYPAGKNSARFRLNLSFRGKLLELAWQQIEDGLLAVIEKRAKPCQKSIPVRSARPYYDFHLQFAGNKLTRLRGDRSINTQSVVTFLTQSLANAGYDPSEFSIDLLDKQSYPEFRDRIWQLQTETYEPLRQTPIEKFDALIQSDNQLAIVVTRARHIVAMGFAAPLANFPYERGLRNDPFFHDPDTVYMLDLTVVPEFRGLLGRVMKQAICLFAQQKNIVAIQGRNRDRLARGMWGINLSLGSYATKILADEYLDDEPFRDCLIYRCPIQWRAAPINLSEGVLSPLDDSQLTIEFIQQNLPSLVNKLTLSNFVTRDFLDQLSDFFELLPPALRHGYTASGISECVDKLAKSFWLTRKPRTRLLTIEDSFFGASSFLARGLSGIGTNYFEVASLPCGHEDPSRMTRRLHEQLQTDEILAVFVEPLGWRSGNRIPEKILKEIRDACRQFTTPLVFHDSAGACYRYSEQAFLPGAVPDIQPDAGMVCLGGQMAVCYLSPQYFVDTPLTLISTWDGDACALAQFHRAMLDIQQDVPAYLATIRRYHDSLVAKLSENQVNQYCLKQGAGWFRGPVESKLANMFSRNAQGRYLSYPNYGQMQKFIDYCNS